MYCVCFHLTKIKKKNVTLNEQNKKCRFFQLENNLVLVIAAY